MRKIRTFVDEMFTLDFKIRDTAICTSYCSDSSSLNKTNIGTVTMIGTIFIATYAGYLFVWKKNNREKVSRENVIIGNLQFAKIARVLLFVVRSSRGP